MLCQMLPKKKDDKKGKDAKVLPNQPKKVRVRVRG